MSEESRSRGGSGMLAVIAAVMLLVAYPLSIGPAIVVHRNVSSRPAKQAIETMYVPLESLHNHAPRPMQNLLEWYIDLWE